MSDSPDVAGHRRLRFPDTWADFQYIEIEAANEHQARAQVEVMHPGVQGFVIDDIRKVGGGFE